MPFFCDFSPQSNKLYVLARLPTNYIGATDAVLDLNLPGHCG